MNPDKASRRTFLMASLGLSAVSVIRPASRQALTVGQVIDRIKTNVAIPWREQTVDNLIAGTQEMPVKGIASTMMATLDVLQRAAAKGLNMVITHEPTFIPIRIESNPSVRIHYISSSLILSRNMAWRSSISMITGMGADPMALRRG